MRTAESDIIIVPGLGGSGPDHWQTRWQLKLSTARRVEQEDWDRPDPASWSERIVEAVAASRRPALIVAHSLGVVAVAHAAPAFPEGIVRGAFLVAMPDVERPDLPAHLHAFSPIPRDPLPFPSLLVASRNDPYADYARAEDLSYSWGAALVDAGEVGHLNAESGFGPWPEGLMRLAGFMRHL
ncbi:RBBP9/YdeN family alpha/beta hydrolase [uncultured Enterovirga sp.]|uniref:RBBP9/YdeN family alpha/beta hydrolase n=1 Tax=uncultured Enterovirga sp. TaxID=2026352 RepID=UPI0035CBE366